MRKLLYYDKKKCTGCRYCEVICHLRHDDTCSNMGSRIRLVSQDKEMAHQALFCSHCGKPVCRELCTAGAIVKDTETGLVTVDRSKCTGCWSCLACPNGGMVADDRNGLAVNCDLCGGDPACVKFCSAGALQYISVDNIRASRAVRPERRS